MVLLKEATTWDDFQAAVELFREYAAGLGFDLGFQNFDEELSNIESQYSRPSGMVILVFTDSNIPVGCAGIRKFEPGICELKRMYLRETIRGKGAGKELLKRAIEAAGNLGYEKMRLDTLPTMAAAVNVYLKAGFYEIPQYRENPFPGAKFFEIALK